jgi:hypothetical protein
MHPLADRIEALVSDMMAVLMGGAYLQAKQSFKETAATFELDDDILDLIRSGLIS